MDETKKKRSQNISDEERQKRRERMIELRKKLAEVKETSAKTIKTIIQEKQKKLKKQTEPDSKPKPDLSDEDSESESSEEEEQPQPQKKTKQTKPKTKQTKPPVRKVVKIKYFGDITDEQIEADSRLLANLHNTDNEYEDKKAQRKAEKKKMKQNENNTKIVEETPKIIEETPKVIEKPDPEKLRLERYMREVFG
jgi:uncharacterized caspase-like protein